jgi:hypothetical protein
MYTPLTDATADFCFAPPAYRAAEDANNAIIIIKMTLKGVPRVINNLLSGFFETCTA